MIQRQGVSFNNDFKIMFIEIPDKLKITCILTADLKEGWRDFNDYSKCQRIGDQWYNDGNTPLLKVPSAVLNDAFNYVVNTTHSDFKGIKLIETTDLIRIKELKKFLNNSRLDNFEHY
jgi:RES domain-containing protein